MPGFSMRKVKTLEDVEHNFRVVWWLLTGRADTVNVRESGSADSVDWDDVQDKPTEFIPIEHGNTKHDPNFLSEVTEHGNEKHSDTFMWSERDAATGIITVYVQDDEVVYPWVEIEPGE